MKKPALAAALLAALSACATPKELGAIDSAGLGGVDVNGGDFEALVGAIGKDSALLTKKSREANLGEGLFGLSLLAAATYGGFTTAFGGSDNLKDAAFAAATLGSLQSFLKPADRRDAYAKAAEGLKCVYQYGSVFAGSKPARINTAASSANGEINLSTALGDDARNSVLAFLGAQQLKFKKPDASFGGKALVPKTAVEQYLIEEYQYRLLTEVIVNFAANAEGEREAYNQRFQLVTKKYLEIVGQLYGANKFKAPGYKTTMDEIAAAVKKAVETKAAADKAASNISTLLKVSLPAGTGEEPGKYAEAKAKLLACGGTQS